MKYVMLLLLFLMGIPLVSGATLYGVVYSFDLERTDNVKVEIDSTPVQRDVTENGTYTFEIEPGRYTLTAQQFEDGILIASAQENITIAKEGTFVFDLILFPEFEELELETVEVPDVELLVQKRNWVDFIFILLFLIMMFIFVYYFRVKPEEKKEMVVEEKIERKEETKEGDLDKIIKYIKKEGGRITQKELRKAFPYSEGKMSLMIAELEDQGKLKKIKRGRGNILVLQ